MGGRRRNKKCFLCLFFFQVEYGNHARFRGRCTRTYWAENRAHPLQKSPTREFTFPLFPWSAGAAVYPNSCFFFLGAPGSQFLPMHLPHLHRMHLFVCKQCKRNQASARSYPSLTLSSVAQVKSQGKKEKAANPPSISFCHPRNNFCQLPP